MPRTPNPKPRRSEVRKPIEKPRMVRRKGWGGVARKGATTMLSPEDAARKRRDESPPDFAPTSASVWLDEGKEPDAAPRNGGRKASSAKSSAKSSTKSPAKPSQRPSAKPVVAEDVEAELRATAGAQGERLLRYFSKAAEAYAADRFGDAKHELKVCLDIAPDAAAVQELLGMILYRQGRWAPAIKALRKAHLATQSFSLYPALMDAERANGSLQEVDRLWDELRRASPGAEIIAEGRIVYASYTADQGKLPEAIRILEKAPKPKGDPELYHLRTTYVLASLYERTGDVAKARMLYEVVVRHDPDFADAAHRLQTLS